MSAATHTSRMRMVWDGSNPVKDASRVPETATRSESPVPALAKSKANRPADSRRIQTHTHTGCRAQDVKFPPMIFTP